MNDSDNTKKTNSISQLQDEALDQVQGGSFLEDVENAFWKVAAGAVKVVAKLRGRGDGPKPGTVIRDSTINEEDNQVNVGHVVVVEDKTPKHPTLGKAHF